MTTPNILLVDEGKDSHIVIEQILLHHNARLHTARSGTEALDLLRTHRFAVALLDVWMSEMDGYALAERMRAAERTRDIPIILIMGSAPSQNRLFQGYDLGAVVVLLKPINPRVLDNKLRIFLHLHRQREELAESRRRLQALMDAAPVGISVSHDATCQHITGNPALLRQFDASPEDNLSSGAPTEDAAGRYFRFVAGGRELAPNELPLQRAVHEGRLVGPLEFEVQLPNGRIWHAEASGAPMRDEEGHIVGGVAITVDITRRKRLEEALRASEARFRGTFQNAAVGVAHISEQGRWLRVNQALARITGYTEEELLQKTFSDITHPDDCEKSWALVRSLLAGQCNHHSLEKRYIRKDGAIVWIQLTISRAKEAPSRRPYFIGIIEDIQARKTAERERQKLVELIEHSNDFIATADLDGRLTYINAGGRRMLGLGEAEDIETLHIADYVAPAFVDFFHSTVLPKAHEHGIWEGEMQLRHLRTGELIDVFRSIFLITDPETAAPWCFATVTRNITAKKRAEAALKQSERRLQVLADAMPQLVWTADENGVVDYCNARANEYAGLERAPDWSWPWQPIVHPDDLQSTHAAWKAALDNGQPYSCEHRLRMAGGAYRWHLSRALLVREPAALQAKWLGTATDIHDRKQAEQRLRENENRLAAALDAAERAVRAHDQLVALVSHDLRNPLGAITMQVAYLRMQLADDAQSLTMEQLDSGLSRIERQAMRMTSLINELLDIERLKAGQTIVLQRKEVDLITLTRQLTEDQTRVSPAHHIELCTAAATLVGMWDAERLERVIQNLLSNAIKYSPKGGKILVEIEADPPQAAKWALLRVTDHGLGIPEGDRSRVFEWFARGGNVETSSIGGTGIGLASARQIIEQHGGAISVESQEGKGSTFTVRLPIELPHDSPAKSASEDARPPG